MKIICAAPSQKEWNARIKAIKSREFSVLTAADILDMDDFEVKLLMLYNTQFYTLAIEALGQYVDMFLAQTNEFMRCLIREDRKMNINRRGDVFITSSLFLRCPALRAVVPGVPTVGLIPAHTSIYNSEEECKSFMLFCIT